jgi:hypothetical protein
VFVDLGYRGVEVPNVTIYKARQKRGVNTRRLKRALKRKTTACSGATISKARLAMPCTPSCAVQATTSA